MDPEIIAVAEAQTAQTEAVTDASVEVARIEADARVEIAEAEAAAAVGVAEAYSSEVDEDWLRSKFQEQDVRAVALQSQLDQLSLTMGEILTLLQATAPLIPTPSVQAPEPEAEPEVIIVAEPDASPSPPAAEPRPPRRRLM